MRKLFRSKTFWLGLGTIIYGAVQCAHGDSLTGINTIILGAGMVTGRDAIAKLEK